MGCADWLGVSRASSGVGDIPDLQLEVVYIAELREPTALLA